MSVLIRKVTKRDTSFSHYVISDTKRDLSVDITNRLFGNGDLSDSDLKSFIPLYSSLLDDAKTYLDVEDLLSTYCTKTKPMDFYHALFPKGSFEREGHFEDGLPNGLAMVVSPQNHAKTVMVYDGLSALSHLQGVPFAFMSPIGYIGKTRKAQNARQIYALAYDLDGITLETLGNILKYWQGQSNLAPKATWIIHSGYGIHLYYQFIEPIPAYPNLQNALKELKYRLLPLIWNKYTSNDPYPQKQGIMQGFRIVGTGSKLGIEYPVTAYRFGDTVTVDYLLSYIGKQKERESFARLFRPLEKGSLSLNEAKELYPDWYKRKIKGKGKRQTWHVKRDLYDWWLRTLKESDEVVAGHRYFCIMCLSIYARKCDITEEELTQDALSLVPYFDTLRRNDLDTFTEDDAIAALSAYADSYATFPRKDMEALSGISMPPNKRNGRKQAIHLERARVVQSIDYPYGSWRNKEGRPKGSGTKKELVINYAVKHPKATQREIAKALTVSPATVNKWLKVVK